MVRTSRILVERRWTREVRDRVIGSHVASVSIGTSHSQSASRSSVFFFDKSVTRAHRRVLARLAVALQARTATRDVCLLCDAVADR